MVKDYLDEIEPEDTPGKISINPRSFASPYDGDVPPASPERSIRNISVPQRRAVRMGGGDIRTPGQPPGPFGIPGHGASQELPRKSRRVWIWVGAVAGVLILGVLAAFAFRASSVTITPTSRAVIFDDSVVFEATPAGTATSSALTYVVSTSEIEDSGVVASEGTEQVSKKAQGTVTLYNAHSAEPARLIANTRIETPNGLVYRIPNAVAIPGKKGATPGTIRVIVQADKTGEAYNIGPVERFSMPGLKSSSDMYKNVYARSTEAMAGGFEGVRPKVLPGSLESARAQIRSRLEGRAREAALALSNDTSIVFPDLAKVIFESLPQTAEAGGGVRIRDKARVEIPVFQASEFSRKAAELLLVQTGGASISIKGLEEASARYQGAPDASLGVDRIEFSLGGDATVVWDVDSGALAAALAGKSNDEFEAVIAGIPSIAEARARIQPFWKSAFPSDASAIRIKVFEIPTR